ncbi:MAG: PaaI family thioesterase [Draconibacterium sp.]
MDEIKALNEFCAPSMIGLLGITFIGATHNSIQATMPVNVNTMQPTGVLHGGASLALAETIAGAGSYLLIDKEKFNVFGIQISGNHISTVEKGTLFANALLIHKGKTTHVWDVKITDGDNKLISTVRVTNIVTAKKRKES